MKTSLSGMLVSGLLLAGLPFVAIAKHWHIEAQDIRLEVSSEISPRANVENVDILSEINTLDISELSGSDNINRWDTVFVHMARGPDMIAYPFAITHDKPDIDRDEYAFSIRGTVTARKDSKISVRYHFETFLPSLELKPVVEYGHKSSAVVELAINRQAVARLVAVKIDGVRYPYRVIEKPVLTGLTN